MTKNPLLNSLCASLYIIAIASFMFFGNNLFGKEDNFLMPVAMLSLLTLSVTVMGYLFMYQPILMLVDGQKKKAVSFFLQTVAAFAVQTLIVFGILILIRK